MQQQQQQQQSDDANLLSELANKELGSVSDRELEDLLSQQDLGSFAESLLKQIQADVGDMGKFEEIKSILTNQVIFEDYKTSSVLCQLLKVAFSSFFFNFAFINNVFLK